MFSIGQELRFLPLAEHSTLDSRKAGRQTMKNLDDYTIPYMLRIGRTPDTERLYTLESRAADAISAAAREFGKVTSELFTMLESFDAAASVAASLAYVDYYRHRQPDLVKHFEDRLAQRSIPVPEGE